MKVCHSDIVIFHYLSFYFFILTNFSSILRLSISIFLTCTKYWILHYHFLFSFWCNHNLFLVYANHAWCWLVNRNRSSHPPNPLKVVSSTIVNCVFPQSCSPHFSQRRHKQEATKSMKLHMVGKEHLWWIS